MGMDHKCACGSTKFGVLPIQSTTGPVAFKNLLCALMICSSCCKGYVFRPDANGNRRILPCESHGAEKLILEAEMAAIDDREF